MCDLLKIEKHDLQKLIYMKLINVLRSKKGDSSLIEILMTILIALGTLLVAFQIPKLVNEVMSLIAVASGEATARDLGGLIAISGAVVEDTTITYTSENNEIVYDVTIEDKVVEVDTFKLTKDGKFEPLKGLAPAILYGYSKIPFNVSVSIKKTNTFTIDKSLDETGQDKIHIK